MTMPPAIVPAGTAEAGLLASIHGEAFSASPGEAWSRTAIASLLRTPLCFALATGSGDAMAMFRIGGDDAELLTIGVAPGARRRGAARALIAAGAARATSAGTSRILLEVATHNASALALYRSLGFAPVGSRKRYYPDGSDALVLALPLSP